LLGSLLYAREPTYCGEKPVKGIDLGPCDSVTGVDYVRNAFNQQEILKSSTAIRSPLLLLSDPDSTRELQISNSGSTRGGLKACSSATFRSRSVVVAAAGKSFKFWISNRSWPGPETLHAVGPQFASLGRHACMRLSMGIDPCLDKGGLEVYFR
jgi:hypothetical protein